MSATALATDPSLLAPLRIVPNSPFRQKRSGRILAGQIDSEFDCAR
jgi:hypothetical protein